MNTKGMETLITEIGSHLNNGQAIPSILRHQLFMHVKTASDAAVIDEKLGQLEGTVWNLIGKTSPTPEAPQTKESLTQRRIRYPLYHNVIVILLCEAFLFLSSFRLYMTVLKLPFYECVLRILITELIPINSILILRMMHPTLAIKYLSKGMIIFFFFWGTYSSWGDKLDVMVKNMKGEKIEKESVEMYAQQLVQIERDITFYQKKQMKRFDRRSEQTLSDLLEDRRTLVNKIEDGQQVIKENTQSRTHNGHFVMDLLLKLIVQLSLLLSLEAMIHRLSAVFSPSQLESN